MNPEAEAVLRQAQARDKAVAAAQPRINYEAGKRMFPKQKAALTRALNLQDEEKRKEAVLLACRKVVKEWDEIFGAWPDDWSRWQRALDDALGLYHTVTLESLR